MRELKRLLLIGTGILGSEILNAVLTSDFLIRALDITIIDPDKIEEKNIPIQRFFSKSDIGCFKVLVIAHYVLEKYHVHLHPVVGWLQKQPNNFYKQFDVIISCVDSIESRRFMGTIVTRINNDGNIFWIDTGIEGLLGHIFLNRPYHSDPCFENIIPLFKNDDRYESIIISCAGKKATHKKVYFYDNESSSQIISSINISKEIIAILLQHPIIILEWNFCTIASFNDSSYNANRYTLESCECCRSNASQRYQ